VGTAAENDAKRKELREKAAKMIASDHFAILGVARTATTEEVKRAFVALAKQWHPDRVPAGLDDLRQTFAEVFAKLEDARVTLSDAAKRQLYVAEGAPVSATRIPTGATTEAQLEYRKAEAFLKKNDLVQADPHIRRAIQLAPNKTDYQAMLVWIQASKPDCPADRTRQLVAELDKLIAKDDSCERAFFYRGTLRKRLDMIPQAMSDYTRAMEMNPHNVDAAREVRLYRMRQEGSPKAGKGKGDASDSGGVGGFFRKLFKG
jgi:tetratricopeptide (TPR) repeat protein